MKRLSLLLLLSTTTIFAKQAVDCNQIFEERREELLREIEKIDEEHQAFEAFKSATNALIDKRETKLKLKEAEVNATLNEIKDREEHIQKILTENKKMLEEIKKAKDNKIGETFAKMKASKAAPILDEMDASKASAILFNLDAKVLGKILSKMDATKASTVVNLIKKGPPFKEKETVEYDREYLQDKIKSKINSYKPQNSENVIDNAKDPELTGMGGF